MSGFQKLLLFLAAVIGGYLFSMVALYPLAVSLSGGHDMNGGIAMGMAFTIAPVVAIVCGLVALAWAARRGKAGEGREEK
ncbi:MAG: hypothetical protein KDJ80_15795 [Nitratireductor sp.]|nr:hypothetical protein [Nitratireductor sp.]